MIRNSLLHAVVAFLALMLIHTGDGLAVTDDADNLIVGAGEISLQLQRYPPPIRNSQ